MIEYHPNVFPNLQLETLRNVIPFEQRSVKVYGKVYPQPRLTKWFGPVPYTYSGLTWEACAMPTILEEVRQQVEQLLGTTFNCVLANFYRDESDQIHWHCDDEELFGPDPEVASVSFGATRRFELKCKADANQRLSYDLENGSLLFMPRGTQGEWLHRVPKAKGPAGPRINLTFRRVV